MILTWVWYRFLTLTYKVGFKVGLSFGCARPARPAPAHPPQLGLFVCYFFHLYITQEKNGNQIFAILLDYKVASLFFFSLIYILLYHFSI